MGTLLSLAAAAAAGAQDTASRVQAEARLDLISARATSLQPGVGITVPAGAYLRLQVVAGAGPAWGGDAAGGGRGTARVDLMARFLLDPVHQFRWGAYAGGGLSTMYDENGEWRPRLAIAMGVEGPVVSGRVVALEAGLGGGARVGVAVRRALHRWR